VQRKRTGATAPALRLPSRPLCWSRPPPPVRGADDPQNPVGYGAVAVYFGGYARLR
jgi:hypothetical protein